MIKKAMEYFSKNRAEPKEKPKVLYRPVTLPNSSKSEPIAGVTIKQVKEILLSQDVQQTVKLFGLMVERDLHLASTLSTRRDQLQSLPWVIDGDTRLTDFCNDYLESVEFELLLQDISSSLEYGFSVLDLNWSSLVLDGRASFVPKPKLLSARFWSYDNDKREDREALYVEVDRKKRYLNGFDSRKVLLHLHKTDTEHITKYSPLYKAAWFVALKHQVIANNMQWYDALGVPPLIITQDTADSKELEQVMYQALSLRSNSVGIFSKDVEAKLLDGSMSKADFLSFIKYVDEQVSFFITGQTLATTNGSTGSYAQAQVHENRLIEKKKFDAKLIARTITELLNIVVSVNFATEQKVKFSFVVEKTKDLKEASEIVGNLENAGFLIPVEHIEKEFKIKGVTRKETPSNNGVASSLNTIDYIDYNTQTKTLPLDKTTAELLNSDLSGVEGSLNERLIKAINGAGSYEEVYQILASDDSVDIEELEKLLVQYIANATLMGVDDGKN